MDIIYVSRLCSEKTFHTLFQLSEYPLEQQVQKYHHLITKGLSENGCNIKCITNLSMILKENSVIRDDCEGNISYHYVRYLKNKLFRYPYIFFQTLKYMRKYCRSYDYMICDCLSITSSIACIVFSKLYKKKSLGILTDMPNDLVTGNRLTKFTNNKILHYFDCFVFLTKDMNDVINKLNKPYVIIEGFVDSQACIQEENNKLSKFTCMYAGGLNVRYGIDKLVKSFAFLPDEFQLYLYGNGDYKDKLKQGAMNGNIHYFGNVPNSEIIKMEKRVHLLINPRPTDEEFTKFSFPSKNMEYMASGTPVLTTKLHGMPQDYYSYVYLIDDETPQGIAKAILAARSDNEFINKGKSAQQFVLQEKNNVLQTKKIMSLLDDSEGGLS